MLIHRIRLAGLVVADNVISEVEHEDELLHVLRHLEVGFVEEGPQNYEVPGRVERKNLRDNRIAVLPAHNPVHRACLHQLASLAVDLCEHGLSVVVGVPNQPQLPILVDPHAHDANALVKVLYDEVLVPLLPEVDHPNFERLLGAFRAVRHHYQGVPLVHFFYEEVGVVPG